MMFLIMLVIVPVIFILAAISKQKKSEELERIRDEISKRYAVEKAKSDAKEHEVLQMLSSVPHGTSIVAPRHQGSIVNRGQDIALAVSYVSQVGELTTRKITMKELKATIHADRTITPVSVLAFCHLRSEERTFYINSITAAADFRSGLLIDDIPLYIVRSFGRANPIRRT